MGAKFLSQAWAEAVTDALNAHEGFTEAIQGVDLTIQFTVTGAPDGDITYYFAASGGSATVALGELEGAELQITNDLETANAISKGDLNTEAAFFTGRLKATGNLAKLMMNQKVISQWRAATFPIEIDY